MKIQGLAVLFIIIIIPISLVTTLFIHNQIDTIVTQTSYDSKLSDASYDAIKAFQLNQSNSITQNIYSERIRDIEASVNTFYNTLGTNMGASRI